MRRAAAPPQATAATCTRCSRSGAGRAGTGCTESTRPTLVLMAADDPIVPPINGHLVASRLSRATLETVTGGHLFMLTRPGETARRIEGFIAAHPLLAEAG